MVDRLSSCQVAINAWSNVEKVWSCVRACDLVCQTVRLCLRLWTILLNVGETQLWGIREVHDRQVPHQGRRCWSAMAWWMKMLGSSCYSQNTVSEELVVRMVFSYVWSKALVDESWKCGSHKSGYGQRALPFHRDPWTNFTSGLVVRYSHYIIGCNM